MSPRQVVDVSSECEYVECVQYYSTSRGFLQRTVICRHPERGGCVCVLETTDVAECELCRSGDMEEAQTVHIDVKRP